MKEVKADDRIEGIFGKTKFAATNLHKRYITDAFTTCLFPGNGKHLGTNIRGNSPFTTMSKANHKSPGSTGNIQTPGSVSIYNKLFYDNCLEFAEKYTGM